MVLYIQIAIKSVNQTFLFSQVCKYTLFTSRAKKGTRWMSWLTKRRFLLIFSHAYSTAMAKLPLIYSYKSRAYPQIVVFYAFKLFSQLHFLALFFSVDLLTRYKAFRTENKSADIITFEASTVKGKWFVCLPENTNFFHCFTLHDQWKDQNSAGGITFWRVIFLP